MPSKLDQMRSLDRRPLFAQPVRDKAAVVRDKPKTVRDTPQAVRDVTKPASTLAADPRPAMTDAERQAKYRSTHLDEVRARERDRKRAERAK